MTIFFEISYQKSNFKKVLFAIPCVCGSFKWTNQKLEFPTRSSSVTNQSWEQFDASLYMKNDENEVRACSIVRVESFEIEFEVLGSFDLFGSNSKFRISKTVEFRNTKRTWLNHFIRKLHRIKQKLNHRHANVAIARTR